MSKSVYSLVLGDEVVAGIDRIAYERGMSRSALINEIMAEYAQCEIPEKRFSDIFGEMSKLIASSDYLRFFDRPSQNVATVKSMLVYRYNPTIKYSVELFPEGKYFGELKISMRTQNAQLISFVQEFFRYLNKLESVYLHREVKTVASGGKFVRKLHYPEGASSVENLAQAVAEYIKFLDRLINVYFSKLGDENLDKIIEEEYLKGYKNTNKI